METARCPKCGIETPEQFWCITYNQGDREWMCALCRAYYLNGKVRDLEKRVEKLEAENKRLKDQGIHSW